MSAPVQSCQPSPTQMRQVVEYLASREPDHDGDIVVMFTAGQRDAFVEAVNSHATLKAALADAIPLLETLHSLLPMGEARRFAFAKIKAARAALSSGGAGK